MTSLAQLRDQAKREAVNYLTDCVLFALAEDKIAETEVQISQLAEQRAELETTAAQLGEDVVSLQSEMKTLSPTDNQENLQQQLHRAQESLTVIEIRIITLEGQGKDLQTQIMKFRSVPVPQPPRGLKNLVVG
jgi:chromosome segregation ATPase